MKVGLYDKTIVVLFNEIKVKLFDECTSRDEFLKIFPPRGFRHWGKTLKWRYNFELIFL